jgi:hypothetical protein
VFWIGHDQLALGVAVHLLGGQGQGLVAKHRAAALPSHEVVEVGVIDGVAAVLSDTQPLADAQRAARGTAHHVRLARGNDDRVAGLVAAHDRAGRCAPVTWRVPISIRKGRRSAATSRQARPERMQDFAAVLTHPYA